jgi:hypothetical protein
MKRVVLGIFLFSLSNCLFSNDYNILNYGAVPGEKATEAIQSAINDCYNNGGGRVTIPSGTYITGTLTLKSNTELHLENGAVLQGSLNLEDYSRTFRTHGIIFCEDAENVSITGNGIIDARGIEFYDTTQNHVYEEFDKSLTRQKENYMPEGVFYTDGPIKRKPKPGMTISFFHCSRVKLTGVLIKDTPSWAVRFAYCDDVLVHGISIYNNLMIPNSDGVHCTNSRNVRMSDCDIRSGDDSFIVTGFSTDEETPGFDPDYDEKFTFGNKTDYAENIVVSNCQFQSRSSGIRIGYGQHPIRRCTFSNIVIYGSNRGIGIFAHDAANIEDITFSNIIIQTRLHNGQWWGNGEPIHLSAVSRFEGELPGKIKNIVFRDIVATSEHGIILYGHEDAWMENIDFDNISLKIIKGKETLTYGGNFDLRPAADISKQLFEHDIPGLYAKHVKFLNIIDLNLEWGEDLPDFFSHGIECEYVEGLKIENFQGGQNPESMDSERIKLLNTTFVK